MKNIHFLSILFFLLIQAFPAAANLKTGYYVLQQGRQEITPKLVAGQHTKLVLKSPQRNNGRVFKVEKLSNGTYTISQALTGLMVDAGVFNGGTGTSYACQGCLVTLKAKSTRPSQKWRLIAKGGGQYEIQAATQNTKLTFNRTNQNFYMNASARVDPSYTLFRFKALNWVIKSSLYTDLRAQQTSYKHQGSRGTCTYFASLAALEAAYKKAGYGNLDLSEEAHAILSKSLFLNPKWSEIKHANHRENQLGATQGGGSIAGLTNIKVPKESDVRYQSTTSGYRWQSKDQRYINTGNFGMLKENLLQARTFYGVKSYTGIPNANLSERLLESILRRGTEIKIGINRGAHVVLLVGFDKTDPNNKRFIIKNSYHSTGSAPSAFLEYLPYSEMSRFVGAEYINEVSRPSPWKELALLGRYKLNFDGWKGTLDFYHLPGTAQYIFNEARNGLKDQRIGVFYDHKGKAHRVNGKITVGRYSDIKVEFYFDGKTPNLRYDQLKGRTFTYYFNKEQQLLAGHHTDKIKGTKFGGFATRSRNISGKNYAATPTDVSKIINSRSTVYLGASSGTITFKGSKKYDKEKKEFYVEGTFIDQKRKSHYVRMYNYKVEKNALRFVRYNNSSRPRPLESGVVRYLNWNNGIFAGTVNAYQKNNPFIMAKL